MSLQNNYKQLREQIQKNVVIVVAAKTRTAQEIREIIKAGAIDLGHNYVQEAEESIKDLGETAKSVRWHLIGHLQKNKAGKAAKLFDVIQTVDSKELALELDKQAGKISKKLGVLIEINVAEEESKSGVKPDFDVILNLATKISSMKNLELKGLMTMGAPTEDKEEMRKQFRTMKDFFDNLKNSGLNVTILSMGMSGNYEIAIREGSNMVRLGTKIFGERQN